MKLKYPRDIDDLKTIINDARPMIFMGSQTSTVIEFDQIRENNDLVVVSLANLRTKLEFDENFDLVVSGAVTWKMAKDFCNAHDRQILTSPTDDSALVLSGLATSATGERCFGNGTLRDQLIEVEFIDYEGREVILSYKQLLEDKINISRNPSKHSVLKSYQDTFSKYRHFKNAPFPRLDKASDLMVGTEGQLGVITKAKIKTKEKKDYSFLFIALNKWEQSIDAHLEIFKKVQSLRGPIASCELIDENSWALLPEIDRPIIAKDTIFLEIETQSFDYIYEKLLSTLTLVQLDDIFEINAKKCQQFRLKIPQAINEWLKLGAVSKKATDIQVCEENFPVLLKKYQELSRANIPSILFGHFGDAHLHFNYLPSKHQLSECDNNLRSLYSWVNDVNGSPFAEHGIGVIKQKFIDPFYRPIHREMFDILKETYDPNNIFFPMGYMSKGVHGE